MALSLRNNSPRGIVGLDIDGGFLAAVHAADGQVKSAVSTELEDGIMSDGEVADGARLASALKDFFKEHDLPRKVRLGVSNPQIVVRQIELPKIEDKGELDAAVRFQAPEAIAMPLDDAVLDYQVTGETDVGGTPRLTVVIVAARRSMIEALLEAVRQAGLKPASVDLDAFALVRMLASELPSDDHARVYCHLGAVTNLALAVGTSVVFTRALSTRLNGDVEQAASALAGEIRLSIDYSVAQAGSKPVAELVISGPGARVEGIAEALEAQTHLPTVVAEPLGVLEGAALPADDDPMRYTVAAGLAMGTAA